MAPSIPAQLVLGHGQTNSSVHFLIRLFASIWRTRLRWSGCGLMLVNFEPSRCNGTFQSPTACLYFDMVTCDEVFFLNFSHKP
jgi:hypothetical protein